MIEKTLKDGSTVKFFEDEWRHVEALGKSFLTKEEKKAFWDGIVEKKKADARYNVFDDFPIFKEEKELSEKDRVRKFGISVCEEMKRKLGGKGGLDKKD